MKNNELRIGNLFILECIIENKIVLSKIMICSPEHIKDLYDINNGIESEELKCLSYRGINITENDLKKFGFEFVDYETDEDVIIQEFKIVINEHISYSFMLISDGFNEFVINTSYANVVLHNNLRYIHELQNMWFMLTGKELTTN